MHASSRRILAFFFAATVAACVLGYHPLRTSIELDNQTFFYIAERAASGVPPHVSVVNHKHALSHLLSAAAIVAGRATGVEDIYAARAISIVVCACTVALVAVLALRLSADSVIAFLSGLAMLTFGGLLRQAVMGFRPQLFATFFVTWALVAYCDRKHARAGVYGTCAFLCWQPAGVVLAAVAASTALEPDARSRALKVLGGAAAMLTAYELYFVLHGALREQLFQTWIMASYGALVLRPPFVETLWFLLSPDAATSLASSVVPASLIGLVLFSCVTSALRPQQALRFWRERADVRAVALTALGSLAFTFIDHQAYPDKFVLLPFMSISAGFFFRRLAGFESQATPRSSEHAAGSRRTPTGRRWRFAVALASCTFVLFVLSLRARNDYHVGGDALAAQRALAAKVHATDGGTASIWAVGCLHLLAFNHQPNYSPFGVFLDERVRRYAGADFRPLVDGRMPRVILWARAGKFRFPWLETEYDEHGSREFRRASVRLWIRKRHVTDAADTEPATPG